MSLLIGYSSDEDANPSAAKDAFSINALPVPKKARIEEPVGIAPIAVPHVLAQVRYGSCSWLVFSRHPCTQDPLNQTSLITRPSDTQMNVNIPYEDMTLPVLGPDDPFRTTNRLANQNALAGHVEEQAMTEHAFRAQHLTQHVLGYSANPSVDPSAPAFLGNTEAAAAHGFATVDTLRAPNEKRRELKRKRKQKGDLDVVDGEGAYVGPWAGWDGDDLGPEVPDGLEVESEEPEEPEPEVAPKKGRNKRGVPGQESSTFHGKQMTDYQGRTYMSPPLAEAPHILSEPGQQETFIPKNCVHTWTGHTQGVSVIRLLPQTSHLLLSGSMDTKIKVRCSSALFQFRSDSSFSYGMCIRQELVYAHSWGTIRPSRTLLSPTMAADSCPADTTGR